jgi:hypothetical protein
MLEAVTEYVKRRQWVVFSLVALFLAIDFGRWLFQSATLPLGVGLPLVIANVVAIFYLVGRRDFFGYTAAAALVILSLSSSAIWLGVSVEKFGIAYAFGEPRPGIENYFRVAEVIVSIPTLIALLAVWRPLYTKRVQQRR